MAQFVTVNYQADNGDIARLKVLSSRAALVGTFAGPISEAASAKASKSSRQIGLRPRYALYKRVIVSGEDAITKYTKIWKATRTLLDNAPANINYNGNNWEFVRPVQEDAD